MPTNYEQLAKIKNHKVDLLTRELEAVKAAIAKKEKERDRLLADLAALPTPQGGEIAEFLRFLEAKKIYRREIETAKREIFALSQKAFQARRDLKKAMIEYEKINHLDREEKAQIVIAAKNSEAKRLDEIAVNTRYVLRK
jgi:flagellar biosynthesis chaperone FliJ